MILVSHRDGLWTSYYTRIAFKTQAAFVEFGSDLAVLGDLGIEAGPLATRDLHDEHPFRYSNLWRSQSDTVLCPHELDHVLAHEIIVQGIFEIHWLRTIPQHTVSQLHWDIYCPRSWRIAANNSPLMSVGMRACTFTNRSPAGPPA